VPEKILLLVPQCDLEVRELAQVFAQYSNDLHHRGLSCIVIIWRAKMQ